jgi:hypothetical protein
VVTIGGASRTRGSTMNNDTTQKTSQILDTCAAWESGRLGRDDAYTVETDAQEAAAIDEALGFQTISIRLPSSMIEDVKAIARLHDVGYQPLMRDVLARWVSAEKKLAKAGIAEAINQIKSSAPRAP